VIRKTRVSDRFLCNQTHTVCCTKLSAPRNISSFNSIWYSLLPTLFINQCHRAKQTKQSGQCTPGVKSARLLESDLYSSEILQSHGGLKRSVDLYRAASVSGNTDIYPQIRTPLQRMTPTSTHYILIYFNVRTHGRIKTEDNEQALLKLQVMTASQCFFQTSPPQQKP
jgi:hypothetical protein